MFRLLFQRMARHGGIIITKTSSQVESQEQFCRDGKLIMHGFGAGVAKTHLRHLAIRVKSTGEKSHCAPIFKF
jgi:hypothetical protein